MDGDTCRKTPISRFTLKPPPRDKAVLHEGDEKVALKQNHQRSKGVSLWLSGTGVAFQSKDPEEEVWHFPASMVDGEA